ncbi:MAG: hypothetical protein QOJ09_1709 [Actinomycetota bacterium]|nr:hypothetical protein [Actinomycetota bacterium]
MVGFVTRYAAMLRGINLGSRNRVAMPALKELFEAFGYTDVSTYVQSGNVAFSAAKRPDAVAIAKRIAKDLGVESPVILRSGSELAKLVHGNPFEGDASAFHVTLLEDKAKAADVKAIDAERFAPDEFTVVGRDVYLRCPKGYGVSKLGNAFWEKKLGTVATTRNWKTITALHDLTSS